MVFVVCGPLLRCLRSNRSVYKVMLPRSLYSIFSNLFYHAMGSPCDSHGSTDNGVRVDNIMVSPFNTLHTRSYSLPRSVSPPLLGVPYHLAWVFQYYPSSEVYGTRAL